MNNLFVYGTLLNESTQFYVFGRKTKGKTAYVSCWQKTPINKGSSIFMARYNKNSQIRGKIIVVSDLELDCIDGFESEGTLYKRRLVTTQSGISTFIYTETDTRMESRLNVF